jgi:hypothetical protein
MFVGPDPARRRREDRPRLFSSALSTGERRVYGAVTAIFVGAFLASMWPLYPLFSRVRPFVFGIPLSLFYLLVLLLVCFFSLLALYHWEARHRRLE